MQFAWGYAPTVIVASAVKHRLFDLLDNGPKTVDQLVKESGASRRGVVALVDALTGLQLLAKSGDRFSLSPEAAAFLVSTKPGFFGAIFRHQVDDILPKWLELDEVVRTGKPAQAVNAPGSSAGFFADFVEALYPMSYPAVRALGDHLGIASAKKPVGVLDLAAGSGVWGITLAEQSPQVRITAVDWPEVLEVTKRVAKQHGVADRLTPVPGDLLRVDFGQGHQVATLGHILHSEGRERSRQLLKKTCAALTTGGTIAIAEFVPNDDRTGPPNALLFAVNMLVNTEAGDTFTFAEMSEWLREAGFKDVRQLDTGAGPSPLLLGTKA